MEYTMVSVLLLVAVGLGQHREFELVEPVQCERVQLRRHTDGRWFVGY